VPESACISVVNSARSSTPLPSASNFLNRRVAIASSSSEKVISSWPSRPSALLPAECSSGFSAAAVAACAAWLLETRRFACLSVA
jgi:hypothetical protein